MLFLFPFLLQQQHNQRNQLLEKHTTHKSQQLTQLSNEKKKKKKDYDTQSSQAVSNPSTIWARRGLTSLIRREVVFSSWCGRNQSFFFSFFSLCVCFVQKKSVKGKTHKQQQKRLPDFFKD